MNRLYFIFLTLFLLLTGLAFFLYKAFFLGFPLSPDSKTSVWAVEAQVSFNALAKPAKLSLMIPRNTSRFVVMDEKFISRGFGLTSDYVEANRQATWTMRNPIGKQALFYQAIIRQSEGRASSEKPEQSKKIPEIPPSGFREAEQVAAQAILLEIKQKSADVQSLVVSLMKLLDDSTNNNVSLLLGSKGVPLRRIQVAVGILGLAGIPARVVHGVQLHDQVRNASVIPWLEIYQENSWRAHDPITGLRDIPDNYFVWWRGENPLSELKGGEKLRTRIAIEAHQERALSSAVASNLNSHPFLLSFSLFSLPVETQLVYRVLLMIPLGALMVVVFRNLIGLDTFGTFMPVLVALAFRETQLLPGLLLFSLVIGLGLLLRLCLEHLKLLLVPRLACILTIVVLLMAVLSISLHKMGLSHGLSVALFPMVIMTMTIERMSIIWDELGASSAIRKGISSLFVASIICLVITSRYVEHMIFVFPELLFIVGAACLSLGRYQGYRLTELWRFKDFADNSKKIE